MKNQKFIIAILLSLMVAPFSVTGSARTLAATRLQTSTQADEEAEKAELDALVNYVPAERIEKLKAFISAHPNSALKSRAEELIVSARAAWADEKLRGKDVAGAMEQFRLAVAATPANMTDNLFAKVVARIPYNLFLLDQRAGALEIALLIEAKVKSDPKRLLTLASFYTSIEDAKEAARVSELAVKLAPDMASAHLALAIARHIALQLDGAEKEYARALELDPQLTQARRSLADLRRATGRWEDALSLYKELLASDSADKQARAGLVLSLLDGGKKQEAERELEAALAYEPRNLALLVGAAYWFAAHSDGARALDLAQRAVEVEPRYVWAQVALSRALLLHQRPLEAEQALRVARRFGRFPTLDYELATILAAAGFYREAASELAHSFAIREGQLETQLAGRMPTRAASFIELLAPERRASIFQATAADTESNARVLKALLAFNAAMGDDTKRESVKEKEAIAAAQEFASGEDPMRPYRQLYAANRLLRAGVSSQAVMDLAEGASNGLEAAADVPVAATAALADELYSVRLQALSEGVAPPVAEVERSVRVNILRGRIEEIAGWVLYNQDKPKESVERLRRAVSLLPENSIWWRSALWRLGAALQTNGDEQEALTSYMRSYNKSAPDEGRRSIIETLYRKLNGSLEGLEAKLGAASSSPTVAQSAAPSTSAAKSNDAPTESPATTQTQAVTDAVNTTQARSEPPASETSAASQSATPAPSVEQAAAAEPASATEAKNAPANPQPASASEPEPTPTPATDTTRPARNEPDKQQGSGDCSFSIDADTITIKNNGGSATVTVQLSGSNKITPTTRDWPDITVFARSLKQFGSFPFVITSISKRTGTYTVSFTTPCGTKDLTVIVK